MLIDGLSISTNISQASLTISQVIFSNFKQKGNNQDHITVQPRGKRNRETPIQLYASLKLYVSIRSHRSLLQDWKLCVIYKSY